MSKTTAATRWPAKVSTCTVFVEDLAAAIAFYTEVFGVPMVFQDTESAVFDFENVHINLLSEAAAPELVAPTPVAPRASGARIQFTVEVDDVDARCADLAARGVTLLNGPMDRRWGMRTASFTDPGGHIWEIAAPLA